MDRLNVEERTLLRKLGFNPKYFIRLSKDWESFTFIEIVSRKKLLIRR